MGILNATPDSFVAGSRVATIDAAVKQACAMVDNGATLLDIGGESTRPGACPVSVEEEIARVCPILQAIHTTLPHVPLSIDTSKVEVAQAALVAGATIINDVHGTHAAPGMWELVQHSGAGYVLMHSRGTSQTMDSLTTYADVIEEVLQALLTAAQKMEALGVARQQIMLDVGLGFAKTAEDSLRLLEATERFTATPYPVLVGASRKRFLAHVNQGEGTIVQRSAIAAKMAIMRGANVVRVHDVIETRQWLEGSEHV